MQVKARVASEAPVLPCCRSKQVTVVRSSHYHQYDTYWSFDDPGSGLAALPRGRVPRRRGQGDRCAGAPDAHRPDARGAFGAVLLSRSRYLAPAAHSARFYREYFRPAARARRRKGSAPLAGRLPRRRVLRAPRPPDDPAAPTATSSRSNRGPGRGATPRTRRPSSPSCSRCSAPVPTTPSATATCSSPPAAPDRSGSLSPLDLCVVQIPPAVDDREMGGQLVAAVARLHGLLQPLDANG